MHSEVSKPALVIKKPFLEVSYDERNNVLIYKWIGFLTYDKRIEGIKDITNAIVRYQLPYLFADVLSFLGGSSDILTYIENIWIKKLTDIGIRKIGLIAPDNYIFDKSSQKSVFGETGTGHLKTMTATLENLYNWLKEGDENQATPETSYLINWREHIISDKEILAGKPIIKGTRLSVEFLLGRLASGWTAQQILDNYERLTKEDLQAMFAYVQECLRDGLLYDITLRRSA